MMIRYLLIGICFAVLTSCCDTKETKTPSTLDTDQDGWTDEYEEHIGTNPFGKDLDSDGDGIPDVLERRLGTSEHAVDTDRNGINDQDEDPDEDGLPTWFELKIGTDPGDKGEDNEIADGWGDQDGDGLIDWLEFALGTDPFKTDTDGDGLDDEEESQNPQLDGNNPDSDGDGILDGEDPFFTPEGCTDTETNVQHTYNSCIRGKWHTITVKYYIRRCIDAADQILTTVIEDIQTDQDCDESVAQPPEM